MLKKTKMRGVKVLSLPPHRLGVEAVVTHPLGADIALLRTDQEIDLDEFSPVCLPDLGNTTQSTKHTFLLRPTCTMYKT